ncbi:MAG: adenylate/guanylate cyclase domain-containing protein [Myxococcaceae bacterium]
MRERLVILGHRFLRHWKLIGVIPLAFTAVVLTCWHLEWQLMVEVEDTVYDRALKKYARRDGVSDQVVVLAFDDHTLNTIAHEKEDFRLAYGRWPYSRNIHADLLAHLKSEGARAVVFDLVMDTPNDDDGDAAMEKVIRTERIPVYVGFATHRNASPLPKVAPRNRLPDEVMTEAKDPAANFVAALADEADPFAEPAMAAPGASRELEAEATRRRAAELVAFPVAGPTAPHQEPDRHPLPPFPLLLEVASGAGVVEPEEDPDGVLRGTKFAWSDPSNDYVTLPVAVAADLYGAREVRIERGTLQLGERSWRINADGSARIDYGGQLEERFKVYSVYAALNDFAERDNASWERKITPGAFRDKVVVLGGIAVGTADVKATPFQSLSPGVVKQAAVLDTLLDPDGRFITRAPLWLVGLTCFIVTLLLVATMTLFRSTVLEVGLPALLYVGFFAVTGLIVSGWGIHLPATPVVWAGIGGSLTATAIGRFFADRNRELLKESFVRYLDRTLVEQMAESNELPRLEGENREITAFFSDIRGFSSFSEDLKSDPHQLVRILNTYLTRVSAALMREGGCLDKYIGDAVVCLFGAPLRLKDHAVRACRAALAVQAEVAQIREEFRAQGLPDVYTRIGLNSGVMFVGNFGSEQLFDYTAMGDGMNLASRLEGANKAYDTLIMIGQNTWELAMDFIEVRELDRVRVAGKSEAVAVYELLAMKGELDPGKRQIVELYAQALDAWRRGKFAQALVVVEGILRLDPHDGPTLALKKRCETYIAVPPRNFDGVTNLEK